MNMLKSKFFRVNMFQSTNCPRCKTVNSLANAFCRDETCHYDMCAYFIEKKELDKKSN